MKNDEATMYVIIGVIGLAVFIVFIMLAVIQANNASIAYLEPKTITIVDHDESDHTVYTDTGKIYAANKYVWKTLQVNQTYACNISLSNWIHDCQKVIVKTPVYINGINVTDYDWYYSKNTTYFNQGNPINFSACIEVDKNNPDLVLRMYCPDSGETK